MVAQEKNILGEKSKHKILIVDDHPIVCQGLAQLINQEPDLNVFDSAGNISQALEIISENRPEVVIVDISLGHDSGIRLIEDLTRDYPDISVLVLSMHDEAIYAERCLKAGAKGYIMKQEPPDRVISALRKILKGEVYIGETLAANLLHKFVTKKSPGTSPLDILSNREMEVFQLIGQGLKTKKIAELLNLSVKTIETYVDHIKKKMKFDDSRSLFLYAVRWTLNKDIL